MKRYFRIVKKFFEILLGKEIYVRLQVKIQVKWYGKQGAGFYLYPININNQSVVYSFGIGEDISFDEELIKDYNCTVFGFDPTPKTIEFIKNRHIPANFVFFSYGIHNYDGNAKFFLPQNPKHVSCTTYNRWGYDETNLKPIEVPMKKLSTIIKQLGHSKIDILKLDIEGSEYDVMDDILDTNISIGQILIEFHHRFPNIGLNKTKETLKKLNQKGFLLAAISESREEYTFVHKDMI